MKHTNLTLSNKVLLSYCQHITASCRFIHADVMWYKVELVSVTLTLYPRPVHIGLNVCIKCKCSPLTLGAMLVLMLPDNFLLVAITMCYDVGNLGAVLEVFCFNLLCSPLACVILKANSCVGE